MVASHVSVASSRRVERETVVQRAVVCHVNKARHFHPLGRLWWRSRPWKSVGKREPSKATRKNSVRIDEDRTGTNKDLLQIKDPVPTGVGVPARSVTAGHCCPSNGQSNMQSVIRSPRVGMMFGMEWAKLYKQTGTSLSAETCTQEWRDFSQLMDVNGNSSAKDGRTPLTTTPEGDKIRNILLQFIVLNEVGIESPV